MVLQCPIDIHEPPSLRSTHDNDGIRPRCAPCDVPRWAIFRSDAGAFYATRRGVALSAAEISAGIQQTVCADDLGGLVGVLQEQDIRR